MSLTSKSSSILARRPANRDLDDIGIAVEIHVPDIRCNLGAAHHLALLAREQLQQRELARGQLYPLACTADLAARYVDFQIRNRQRIVLSRGGPLRASVRTRASSSTNANGLTR